MDAEGVRHLFNSLREDIQSLKSDVHIVIEKHENALADLEERIAEAEKFHAKFLGFGMALVILLDIGFRVAEVSFR